MFIHLRERNAGEFVVVVVVGAVNEQCCGVVVL